MSDGSSVSSGGESSAPVSEVQSSGSGNLSVNEELNEVLGEDSDQEDAEGLAADGEEPSKELKKAVEAASQEEIEKAKKALKKKYTLKVDGQEIEEEYGEEDIIRELQLAKKARKEIQTSSNIKKEAAQLLKLLKENPELVLADPAIGIDPIEFAQKILSARLEEEAKDPSVREKEKLEKELQDLRNHMKQEKEEREQEEYERLVSEAERDLEEKVTEALETSGMPKTPYVLKKLSEVMYTSLQNGIDISPKQALNIVRRERDADIKAMLDNSPDDALEELIGRNNMKRLNKKALSRLKKPAPTANSIRPTGNATQAAPVDSKNEKISIKDWLRSGR